MKIEYNVPCPPTSDPRIRKDYIPLYNQIFYFMHDKTQKELVLKCDTPRAFKCNLLSTLKKYGDLVVSISQKKKEVRVFSCEKV